MRRFDDNQVSCPYYKEHVMPSLRLQWHLPKCEKRFRAEFPNIPILHCKYDYLHIYLTQEDLVNHEPTCIRAPADPSQRKVLGEISN